MLLNLLTNARRAMPDGGEITVETSHLPATRSVRLLVRDTGSGIPPEILPKIFDPLFHHEAGRHREVGKGTIFTLTFPLDSTGGV